MKKGLNIKLREKQELDRKETIKKVLKAIEELRGEGYEIATKLLIERTSLSRSTFSKTHVIEVLREQRVCRFKDIKTVTDMESKEYLLYIQKKLREYEIENRNLKKELNVQINKNFKLEKEIAERQEQCETLRGQLMVLYQKASNRGVDLEL